LYSDKDLDTGTIKGKINTMTIQRFIQINTRLISFVVFCACMGGLCGQFLTGLFIGLAIVAAVNCFL
jgi:hypothetical protein